MTSFLKVTAITPNGNFSEYMFMGDLKSENDQNRLKKFTDFCRKETADRFCAPFNWDAEEWERATAIEFEMLSQEDM